MIIHFRKEIFDWIICILFIFGHYVYFQILLAFYCWYFDCLSSQFLIVGQVLNFFDSFGISFFFFVEKNVNTKDVNAWTKGEFCLKIEIHVKFCNSIYLKINFEKFPRQNQFWIRLKQLNTVISDEKCSIN